MASKKAFYAAVRVHLRNEPEVKKQLTRKGFKVSRYSGGWAYVRSGKLPCGKARQKKNTLQALTRGLTRGPVGLMTLGSSKHGIHNKRLAGERVWRGKCPR